MTPRSRREIPPAPVPIHKPPARPAERAMILASFKPALLVSKAVKRTPSKRTSPPKVPIHR